MKKPTNQRNYFKTTGSATFAANPLESEILGQSGQTSHAAAASSKKGIESRIEVHHEWGALKEVVCGIPHFLLPNPVPKIFYNFVASDGIKFFETHKGKTVKEADPELYDKQTQQMDAVVSILEKRGVKVHRPEPIVKESEVGYLDNIFSPSVVQVYPRDPMLVIGNHLIETELMWPMRRRERFGIRRLLSNRLAASNARVVSMPPAIPQKEDDKGGFGPGPFLEGGDVFLLGDDIYVGISGSASNDAGINWLQQYLGDKYRVHKIVLTKKFLHLDCCLATPRPGLAIICREAFVNGVPAFLKDWDLIDVSFEDAHERLATNGLVLDETAIIIASGLGKLAKSLRDAGQEVIETPFDSISFYGGSLRCWHHPLVRDSKLEA